MNIFYVECKNQYSLDLIATLSGTAHPVTHVGAHGNAKEKQRLIDDNPVFKGMHFIDSCALYKRSTLKKNYSAYFKNINLNTLNYFDDIERDFYILTDRSNYNSVSFRERKLYFRDLIRFWIGYLKQETIEAVYCPYAPHTGWELVLMKAAKFLDIPFVYFSHTAINNRSLLREDYKTVDIVPDDYLSDLSMDDIRSQIDPDLLADFEADSIVTEAVKAENDEFNKQNTNTNKKVLSKINNDTKAALKENKVRKILSHYYHHILKRYDDRFYLPLAMDDQSNLSIWSKLVRKHKKFAGHLKNYYEQNCSDIDLLQPFIYFPMHLQPEMTTQPEAGIYEDHYLVLEQLIQALPDGWYIYIKENPRQYDTTINTVSAMSFRDQSDMLDLLNASEKVKFVPQSIATPDLIQNAKVVVTQTGTVGWECLTSGKPCIAMARPWYSGCTSCYKPETIDDLRQAITLALKATKEEVKRNLLCYLHYYQDKLFIGSLSDPSNVAYNTRPYDELLQQHKQAIISHLDQFNKKDKAKKSA